VGMEIVNESAALLSNFEVLALLKDISSGKNGQRKPGKKEKNVATITYSTLKYLEKTPCGEQSTEAISKFMLALKPFRLTRAEKLQLLNLRPSSAVEIQLIIEESEERLSEEEIDDLLEVVASCFPAAQSSEGAEAMDQS